MPTIMTRPQSEELAGSEKIPLEPDSIESELVGRAFDLFDRARDFSGHEVCEPMPTGTESRSDNDVGTSRGPGTRRTPVPLAVYRVAFRSAVDLSLIGHAGHPRVWERSRGRSVVTSTDVGAARG